MLTRKRDFPERLYERSQSPWVLRRFSAFWLSPIRSMAIRCVSAAVSTPSEPTLIPISFPLSSTCEGLPGDKMRSLTLGETCSIAARIAGVETAGGGGVVVAEAGAGVASIRVYRPWETWPQHR